MISVVICHHKGDLILNAIESLNKSKGIDHEVIVVTSEEGREFVGARTVYQQGGPAIKRNIGVKFAQGEYIAFYDDDIEADAYSLYHMQKVMIERDAGMVFGKLLNMEYRDRFDEAGSYLTPSGFLWARAESGVQDRGQFDQVEPVLAGKSAACMIRRKVFWETGAFDSTFEILGEETDLAWRVWLYGHKIFYVPSSITYHAFNTKFKPRDFYIPRRVYFNGCRNYLSMLIANLEYRNLIFPLTCQVVVWTAAAIGMLATGKREAGIYILKGLGYVATHLGFLLCKRKKVQAARKVRDAELLPIIMRTPPLRYYLQRFVRYIQIGLHG